MPRARAGGAVRPVTPQGRGRFGDYDVLQEVATWDDVTRRVVLARLDAVPALAFFDRRRAATAHALTDRLLAQDCEPRVPVVAMIDLRLAQRTGYGWRHDDMPEDGEAWLRSLDALDDDARRAHRSRFSELDEDRQQGLIAAVRDAHRWHDLPGDRVYDLWIRYSISAFYAHPWAWNEIGFGGPAYPRGYKNIGVDRREPWERREEEPVDPVPFAHRVEAAHQSQHDRTSRTTRGVQPGSGQHAASQDARSARPSSGRGARDERTPSG